MRIAAYQARAVATNELPKRAFRDRYVSIWGMVGEIGSIASVFKKKVLYHKHNEKYFPQELSEELGDTLWYMANVASILDLDLSDIAMRNLRKNLKRMRLAIPKNIRRERLSFANYAELASKSDFTDQEPQLLFGLVKQIGATLELFQEQRGMPGKAAELGFRDNVKIKLGNMLWYLAVLAYKNRLNFNDVAERKIKKAEALYSKGSIAKYDFEYAPDERLPRRMTFDFSERKIGNSTRVTISVKGIIIGDKLSDNSHKPDDYRYHDVFHLAYMAVLGWSPVFRDLLKRKRKSDPDVDENEDGARAKIIEEAITLFVFSEAKRQWKYSEDTEKIDYRILSTVKALSSDLEVKTCTAKQWEKAILLGYAVWRQVKEHSGGKVRVDMEKAKLTYLSS